MSRPSAAPRRRRLRPAAEAGAYDVISILVFVIIGRFNHDDGLSVGGIFTTFWPFAVGAALGWAIGYLVSHLRSGDLDEPDFRPSRLLPEGVVIWLSTLIIGMVMRDQFGQGIAVSFVIVAAIVLGVFLVGWRLVRKSVARRRAAA